MRGQLDEIVQVFQRCILELQQHEPEFWQLRVVEYIHHVVKAQVGKQMLKRESSSDENELYQNENDDANATPVSSAYCEPIESLAVREQAMLDTTVEMSQSGEFASASEQIYGAVRDELLRLSSLLDGVAETACTENQRGDSRRCPDFLQLFWKELERTMREGDEHSRYSQRGGNTTDDAVSCSFEAISFDDLNDECGSANRCVPCYTVAPRQHLMPLHSVPTCLTAVVRLLKTSRPSRSACSTQTQTSGRTRLMISWRYSFVRFYISLLVFQELDC